MILFVFVLVVVLELDLFKDSFIKKSPLKIKTLRFLTVQLSWSTDIFRSKIDFFLKSKEKNTFINIFLDILDTLIRSIVFF